MVITWNDLKPAKHIYSDQLGSFHAELKSGRGGNHRPDGFAVVLGNGQNATTSMPLTHTLDLSHFVKEFVTKLA